MKDNSSDRGRIAGNCEFGGMGFRRSYCAAKLFGPRTSQMGHLRKSRDVRVESEMRTK
jgi:hypothetical protein